MSRENENKESRLERIKRGVAEITAKALIQNLLEFIYAHGDDEKACDEAFSTCVKEMVEALYDKGYKK